MKDILPVPIVREEKMSREARILVLKAKLGGIRTRSRLNLEAAIEAGEHLIELKKTCKHGEWLPLLESIPLPRRTASEYIALAKWVPLAHLEDCESISEARALMRLTDAEEQEIPELGETYQTNAFFDDEASYERNGNPTPPPDDKPKTPEPRTPYCDACIRALRVGQTLPKVCKDCKAKKKELDDANPWKKQPRPPKPPTGGFSGHALRSHFQGILRHLRNMAKDFGLVDGEKVNETPAMAEAKKLLFEAGKIIKEELHRLKHEAKGGTG